MQPDALTQSLQDCDEMIKRSLIHVNDRDYSFCPSPIPMLNEFLQRVKRCTKIKTMQFIYELQYGIEE